MYGVELTSSLCIAVFKVCSSPCYRAHVITRMRKSCRHSLSESSNLQDPVKLFLRYFDSLKISKYDECRRLDWLWRRNAIACNGRCSHADTCHIQWGRKHATKLSKTTIVMMAVQEVCIRRVLSPCWYEPFPFLCINGCRIIYFNRSHA